MNEKLKKLREAYNTACTELEARVAEYDALPDDASQDDVDSATEAVRVATELCESRDKQFKDAEAVERARGQHKPAAADPEPTIRIGVDEPDMYAKHGFLYDLFRSQIQKDPTASERLARHQAFELEKRALTTSTFGGLIPPQYLVDMYAKALRNGRVFVDQVNRKPLPEEGMSLIVPRLMQGLAADVQSSENTTVATQDITETDLTVPVRTIAGYSPVSRQGLERAAYNEEILMEDLVARYWAKLDAQAINADGTGQNLLGLLATSGIKTSAAAGGDLIACWANIADVVQQINAAVGGLGYVADKLVMHPRRWGKFVATFDDDHRPLLGINGTPQFNVAAQGDSAGYGFMGTLQGLNVYSDANVPTNLGSGDEDAIIVMASQVVHLWERDNDPVTLAFEQQAGTELSIRLIAYGYVAFTAGRYPAAVGKVTGLHAPTFGS